MLRTALVFLGVLGAGLLTFLPTTLGYVTDLSATEDHLRTALKDLEGARMRPALGHLMRARIRAGLASAAASSPLLRLATSTGPLADDAPGLDALLGTARDLSAAGIRFVGSSDIAGLSDVYREDRFDLAAIERLGAASETLMTDLAAALAALSDVEIDIDSRVGRRVAATRERLAGLSEGLARAQTFMEMVPSFMGAEAPKRYLLALQSPSEARGGGGLIGVYGVVSLDAGQLDLEHVGPVEELLLRRDKRIPAPRWFMDSYGPFSALEGDMRQVNLSPNFPPTARVMLETYSTAKGEELDGVIALDPLAIGELLRGTGPLRAPGWDQEINRESVRRALLHDIYRHFDYREREQNRYLRGLIDVFMEALKSDDLDVAGLITGLGVAADRQHLKLFARDPYVQERIAELQVDGDYTRAGNNVQIVFNNNFAANKVDFFLKRTVHTTVLPRPDGSASVRVVVSLRNEAPDEKTVLVRPLNPALPFGTNHMLLGFISPRASSPGRITAEGRTVIQIPRKDADRPLTLQAVEVAAGQTEEVVYRYEWARAWDPAAGLEFVLWPQAAVRPDFFTLTVAPPPGEATWEAPRGWAALADGTVEVSGRLREPFRAVLRLPE